MGAHRRLLSQVNRVAHERRTTRAYGRNCKHGFGAALQDRTTNLYAVVEQVRRTDRRSPEMRRARRLQNQERPAFNELESLDSAPALARLEDRLHPYAMRQRSRNADSARGLRLP